jgi:ABC-type glycerol-3-phosphate transport system substrate-binding protein
MNVRSLILAVVLGVPALALLAFGPRRSVDIPSGRTVIHYWEKWSGVEKDAMVDLVNEFNETIGADRGIWVDYCAVSNIDQRMLIATAGGDPPDVAGIHDKDVAQYADQGALQRLDDAVVEAGIDLAAFTPIWLEIGRYKDRLYALPSTPYTVGLYYNRRLFRAAGLDPDRPPETLDELREYAVRLTRRDDDGEKIVQLGFTTSPAMLGWWHWIWPYFFDGQLWDGSRFQLDTPAGHAAFNWIVDRRTELGNQAVLNFEATAGAIEGPQNPFLSERLAMVFQGPWVSNWINTYAPDLDYAVAPFPSVTRERRNIFASTDVLVIPRGARHPEEAMEFLAYLYQQDVMERLCKAHCKVSPYREPGPDFFDDHPNPFIEVFDEMARSEHAFGYPQMPQWAHAWSEMLYVLETVLRGERTPKEAITLTQRNMDEIARECEWIADRRRAVAGQKE